MKNTQKINIRLSELEKEIFLKYALCYAIENNNIAFDKNFLCKQVVWSFIEREVKGKPCTLLSASKNRDELQYKLQIDAGHLHYDSMRLQMGVTEEEYNLLELYRQWHIVQTEEVHVSLNTIARRILLKCIYDYFKINGTKLLSEEVRAEKLKEILKKAKEMVTKK